MHRHKEDEKKTVKGEGKKKEEGKEKYRRRKNGPKRQTVSHVNTQQCHVRWDLDK